MVVTADVEEMKTSPSQEKPQEVGNEEVGRGSHFGGVAEVDGVVVFFLLVFSWFGFASVGVLRFGIGNGIEIEIEMNKEK